MRDGKQKALPFAIRCDGAGQENYTDGTPKRWWSSWRLYMTGRMWIARRSWSTTRWSTGSAFLSVELWIDRQGGQAGADGEFARVAREEGNLPWAEETVALDPRRRCSSRSLFRTTWCEDGHVYTRSTSVQNPAAHLILASRKAGTRNNVWLPPIEGFEENAKSPYQFEAQDLKMGYFTGLQVSHEPGQWAVWSGVVLMGIGLALVFYVAHTRFWAVPVKDAKGKLWLWVGGMANRNRDAFDEQFKKLQEKFKRK